MQQLFEFCIELSEVTTVYCVPGLCGSHYFCCQIHRIYGSTGASFAKAQQELAQGVLSNKAVQQTAGNMASSAARATVAGAAR